MFIMGNFIWWVGLGYIRLFHCGGKIVAEGNHKYLMETSTEYQEILASQMKKGVMADGE